MVNFDEIKKHTLEQYNNAKSHLPILEHRDILKYDSEAISDVIPGYKSEKLEFGEYLKDYFAVLFIDMRNSSHRAMNIGPEKTFLSMHAFIPAMLKVVEFYNGYVIDLMGDGLMVFFGGKNSSMNKSELAQNAGLCGLDMLRVIERVVNPILIEDGITYKISCAVGIDMGDVIVTKIGINDLFDVKAFGSCINKSSKFAEKGTSVKVSNTIKKYWPVSKGGNICFISCPDGDGYNIYDKRG